MSKVMVSSRLWESLQIGGQRVSGRSDIGRISGEQITADGFVLTPDIDEAAWNAWHAANIGHALVKEGRVFASAQTASDDDIPCRAGGSRGPRRPPNPLTRRPAR